MSYELYVLSLIFGLIFILKVATNLYKWFRINKLCNLYVAWLANKELSDNIYHYKVEVTDLLSVLPPRSIPYCEPLGYFQVATVNADVLTQFPSKMQPFASALVQMFEEAIGYYKYQLRQCFNPIYWFLFIIWLPKRVTGFIGLNDELRAVKVINIFLQLLYVLILLLKLIGFDIIPLLQHILSKYIST